MGSGSGLIRIVVADDHPVFVNGLAALVNGERDMRVVGEACNGREAVEKVRALRPDVTVLDQQMPEMSGLEAVRAIRAEFPGARIIVLTTFGGDFVAQQALLAGAMGFMVKGTIRQELLNTIRTVHGGCRRVSSEVASQIAHHLGQSDLSERETEVLMLMAHGESNKQISHSMRIAEGTVKSHVKNILQKLGASHRTHAVVVGLRRGIISL